MSNCAAMAAALAEAGAAQMVDDAEELGTAVSLLLSDPRLCAVRRAAAMRVAAQGETILDAVLARLAPWLDRIAPQRSASPEGDLMAAEERAPQIVRA
jgi:3-deoxy-D-manno-octulosonic-acid transferase